MSLTMDFSGDYAVWDFSEAVTFKRHKNSDDEGHTVSTALRSQVTDREKSPSNGAYVGFETNWFLPGTLLGGNEPKPGDFVEDADENVYTILTSEYDIADQVWACGTVDLALANDLSHLIDIERATVTYDAAGAPVRTWTTPAYSQIAAKVQKTEDVLSDTLDVRGFTGNYVVVVGQQVTITAEDRVKWISGGTTIYLDILKQSNPQRIDELPALDCRTIP